MIMRKIQYLFIALFICLEIQAQDKFNIRGVLPWHNFLSGPTSWNLSDIGHTIDLHSRQHPYPKQNGQTFEN